jgi:BlaI family transcriptional regulator, penicillinase repressor
MRLSDTEWQVMHVLWEHAPRTAREVLDEVGAATGWAYTTVKTILARLAEKGAVSALLEGNTSFYTPRITRDEARRNAVRGLLERAFDGAVGSLIHHLAEGEKLSPGDRERLRELIEDAEGRAGEGGAA